MTCMDGNPTPMMDLLIDRIVSEVERVLPLSERKTHLLRHAVERATDANDGPVG